MGNDPQCACLLSFEEEASLISSGRIRQMKCLEVQEANGYLGHIGMEIGNWGQVTDIAGEQHRARYWINYCAPKEVLLNFSHHVSGWLPSGNWKIFQIDNSTGWIDPVQLSLFAGLLFGADNIPDLNKLDNRTFLFEFGKNVDANSNTELLISNLIFVFLLFESHGYVVSSNSNAGEVLGVQDGFIYFSSWDKNISGAKKVLQDFERDPSAPPQWIIEIHGRVQGNE